MWGVLTKALGRHVLHIRETILDALFEGEQAEVSQLDHPSRVHQTIGSTQSAVEANGRLVQIDDTLLERRKIKEVNGWLAISIMLQHSRV